MLHKRSHHHENCAQQWRPSAAKNKWISTFLLRIPRNILKKKKEHCCPALPDHLHPAQTTKVEKPPRLCILILCRSPKLSVAYVLLEDLVISSTIDLLRRQPKNWRTIIPKKFLHCWKSSRVHERFSNLGIQQRESEPPGNLTLKASGICYWTLIGLGKQTFGGHNKTLCAPVPRRKEQWLHRDWARFAYECLGVSCRGVGDSGLPWGQGHWLQQSWKPSCAGISPFQGSHHYCHYPYHSLASGQTTGREHSPTHQQNIGLKTYWA